MQIEIPDILAFNDMSEQEKKKAVEDFTNVLGAASASTFNRAVIKEYIFRYYTPTKVSALFHEFLKHGEFATKKAF